MNLEWSYTSEESETSGKGKNVLPEGSKSTGIYQQKKLNGIFGATEIR